MDTPPKRELMDHLESARRSLFRFEALQEYNAGEIDNIEEWRSTGSLNEEFFKEWWSFLEQKHKAGVVTQRVRRVVYPLNDYTKWELQGHALSVKHGDEIYEIDDGQFKKLDIPIQDFWIVDEKTVLQMKYSVDGKYLGFTTALDAAIYLKYKKDLLNNANRIHAEGKSAAVGEFEDFK